MFFLFIYSFLSFGYVGFIKDLRNKIKRKRKRNEKIKRK